MTWTTKQGHTLRTDKPQHPPGDPRRLPGSHDMTSRLECRAKQDVTSLTHTHTLTWVQGGMQNQTHDSILEGLLARVLQLCNILHSIKNTLSFELGTRDANSNGMNVMVSSKTMFQNHLELKHRRLKLDGPIADLCALRKLSASVDIAGSARAKTISQEHQR